MLFPAAPLPLIVSIAPGAEPAADPDTWDALGLWVDITDDVRVADGVAIETGRQDESSQCDAGKCTLRLDNRSGNYSPRNPLGTYYGELRKNTPIKVELDKLNDDFNRTVSSGLGTAVNGINWLTTGANYAVSPSTGATFTNPTAPAEISNTPTFAGSWNADVLTLSSVNTLPVGGGVHIGNEMRRNGSGSSYYMVARINTTGAVDALIGRIISGTFANVTTVTSVLTGYTANRKIWIRSRTRGDRLQVKIWYDATSEPTAWSASFSEGSDDLDYDSGLSFGKLAAGVGFTFSRFTGNTTTTTANLWSYVTTTPLFVGNVVEWPVRWDKSGNDTTVPVTAAGIIRRLEQGAAPLTSTLYKGMYAGGLVAPYAYWPMEDDSGATSIGVVGNGVKAASIYGATFGWDGLQLGGATSTIEVTQDMTLSAKLPKITLVPTSGFQVNFFLLTPALPPLGQDHTILRIYTTGTVSRWDLSFNSVGEWNAQGFDASGTAFFASSGSPAGAVVPGVWTMLQFECYQSGTSIGTLERATRTDTGVSVSGGFSYPTHTAGYPTQWAMYGSSTSMPTGSVGHLGFFARHSVFDDAKLYQAAIGYAGETPPVRVVRLCAEQNVRATVLGSSTTMMGPQKSNTFLDLLRECEAAEAGGVLYETTHIPGFGFRTRQQRAVTRARLGTTFAGGGIAEPPEPIDDDQALRNDWTVSRINGSSARVTDEEHIAAFGRYDDTIEVNLRDDSDLVDQAAWRVHLGTVDALRWPSIEMDLAKVTSVGLRYTWISSSVGSRVTITDYAPGLPGVPIEVIVEGFTQTLSAYSWHVTMNCTPAKPWQGIGGADDAVMVVDSDESTLNATINNAVTSLVALRPAGTVIWDTGGTMVPFDINMTGEKMTVTAVSGTGTTQTFTVTRGVNGVFKAHTAGETVSLWTAAYVLL